MEAQQTKTYSQFHSEYKSLGDIGEGRFGKVMKIESKNTRAIFALKIITCWSQLDIRDAKQEIQILNRLDHPNIIKVIRFAIQLVNHYREDYRRNIGNPICNYGLVMELGVGSLQQVIFDRNYNIELKDVRRLLAKLICVGAYLQSMELVHRDIKPDNIIIYGPELDFKLADFGLSCHCDRRSKGFAGTPDYSSPKLKQYYHSRQVRVGPPTNPFKDDVYSVALTVDKVLLEIGYNYKREGMNQRQKNFHFILDQMHQYEERDRPTFCDLMKSQFINEEMQIGPREEESPPQIMDISQHFEGSEIERSHNCYQSRQRIQALEPIRRQRSRQKYQDEEREVRINTINKRAEVQHCEQYQFTKMHKPKLNLKPQIFQTKYNIRTVCRINLQYILCGCETGQLIAYDIYTKVVKILQVSHEGYVSKIDLDAEGNIWTCGNDGNVFFFQRQHFLQCVSDKKNQIIQFEAFRSLFKVEFKEKVIIKMNNQDYKVKRGEDQPKSPIITGIFLSQDHYALAFTDGSFYVKWDGKQVYHRYTLQIVTQIKFLKERNLLYIATMTGNIHVFNLNTMRMENNKQYSAHERISSFNMSFKGDKFIIEVLTWKGAIQKIEEIKDRFQASFHEQIAIKNILGACYFNGTWISMTGEGTVYNRHEQILNVNKSGWNCLSKIEDDDWIVAGSSSGEILLLQLQVQ